MILIKLKINIKMKNKNEIKFDDFLKDNLKKSSQDKVSDNFTLNLMSEINSLNLYKKVNYDLQTADKNIKKYVNMFVGIMTATFVLLILFAVQSGIETSNNKLNTIGQLNSNNISVKSVMNITNNITSSLTEILAAKSLSIVSKSNIYSYQSQNGIISIISLSIVALFIILSLDRYIIKKNNI